ncbi:MAG TPA: hypothetical protein VJ351_19230 [Streptosporangiaceae bacterium]|nr:hypothetical protein [Streptosporangiaceae bacterium]
MTVRVYWLIRVAGFAVIAILALVVWSAFDVRPRHRAQALPAVLGTMAVAGGVAAATSGSGQSLVAWRVLIVVLAARTGAHVAASTTPLLFTLGLNRLGQAAVIVPRAMRAGIPFAPEKDGSTFLGGGSVRHGHSASGRY